jgi:transcriptional regulator with XRE-family HTH domain
MRAPRSFGAQLKALREAAGFTQEELATIAGLSVHAVSALEGLVRYCIAEASLAAAGLVGPTQGEWLDRVREDLESYRAALTGLIQRDRSAEASAIASALEFFWVVRGHATEGLQWYEQILSLPSLAPAAKLQVLTGAAMLWYTHGELERARTKLTCAVSLAHDLRDVPKLAEAEYRDRRH